MIVKEILTDQEFESMSWHDSCIHSIFFPYKIDRLILDIDYLFEWQLDKETNLYNFWISPCTLTFLHISDLKMTIDFKNTVGLYILDITRSNPHFSPNGKMEMWSYIIETDKGEISFEAGQYRQIVKAQPILSASQVLPREPDNT